MTRKGKYGGEITSWERGQSGNPNGRPRRALSALSQKLDIDFKVSLSREDKFQSLESLLEMSIEELKAIALDKSTPAFMVIVAGAIRKDLATGKAQTLNELLDRFFGKPKQAIEHTGEDGGAIAFTGFKFLQEVAAQDDNSADAKT